MIVKKHEHLFEAYIERCLIGEGRTLDAALDVFVREMLRQGDKIDPRTVKVFQYMPNEPVYKLLRIR